MFAGRSFAVGSLVDRSLHSLVDRSRGSLMDRSFHSLLDRLRGSLFDRSLFLLVGFPFVLLRELPGMWPLASHAYAGPSRLASV